MNVGEMIASLGLEVDRGSFEGGTKAIEGVKHALEALAVFEGVHFLKEMIEHVSETADQAVKMGQKLGISTEAVQELGYAASLSDVPITGLASSLQKLERRLDAVAQKGKGPAADALRRLGISYKELAEQPVDAQLERIADAFKKLPDNVSKIPLAQALGLGPAMLPLLKDGAQGIRDMREEARTLGLVIDNEVAESFEAWNDDITRVKGAIQGLKNDAVVALLPILREMTTSLFAWIKANRELIKTRLEEVMRTVVTVAKALARAIGILYEYFEKIAPVIEETAKAFASLLSGAGNLEDGLVYAALAIAAAWAFTELPFILLLAGISALILIVQDLWSGLHGGDSVVKELADKFGEYLGDSGVGRVLLGLKASMIAVFDFLEAKVQWLINAISLVDDIVNKRTDQRNSVMHAAIKYQTEQTQAANENFERKYNEALAKASPETRAALQAQGGQSRDLNEAKYNKALDSVSPDTRKLLADQAVSTRGSNEDRYNAAVASSSPDVQRMLAEQGRGSVYQSPTGAGPPITVAAPQMHLNVTVQGNADAQTVAQIETTIREFWQNTVGDAAVATGARRGTLP